MSTSGLNATPPPLGIVGEYGVTIHTGAIQSGDFAQIHNAGFKWIRTDLFWIWVEATPGIFDFTIFDRLAANFPVNDLRPIVILDYSNALYATVGDMTTANSDRFRAAYAAFSAASVAHYAGRGFIWEQWNEPNNSSAWPPAPDSAAYVALMKQACIEIRKKYPQEIIIGPASSGIDLPFIEACLRGGMLDYWSAISVHPYRHTDPATASADYAKLRALIAQYAAPGRTVPIISGEWGYTTAWAGFDDAKQADYLSRMFKLNKQENIPLTIWYDWRDDGDDPTNMEHRFGLVRRSPARTFDPKSAYLAARQELLGIPPSNVLINVKTVVPVP